MRFLHTDWFKRSMAGLLALLLLLGTWPNIPHVYAQEQYAAPAAVDSVQGLDAEPLEGKTISILGASISTYGGTSNGAAATTTNSTIINNAQYYPHSVVTDVTLNDTWWMQVCQDLGLRLLVNNSWSGSSLLYERNGTAGAYVDRCVQLHDDTGDNAGETPDIIGIQMGTNDFQYYKDTLGTADIDYNRLILSNGDGTYTYAEPATSLEAAAIVLHKISVRYSGAEVYYLNISQRVDGTDELIQSFNAELKQVVEHFGAHIVDIYGSAITMEAFDTYIGDGRVHPNRLGMDAYAEAFKRALIASTAYSVDTHTVSLKLDGVTADYGDDKIIVSGDRFTVNLFASDELSVSVTMGGKNITDTAYANGTVTVSSVTDDVIITAESVYIPSNYRWEFSGTDLVCVSGENTLTKNAGTTTDGVFTNTRYALDRGVVLLHDRPWAVEWKCEGTWKNSESSTGARLFSTTDVNAQYNARYIFKSNTNGIIAMGEKTTTGSHNYGLALADYGIDWTALHTYRLENRIAADGSNMIWLYVDGEEIGPMTHYYVGTTDQKTTSDWLSGKDFVFPYMGTDTHGFTNASIDYVAVWEGEHTHSYVAAVTPPTCTASGYTTHTCDCGDSYTDSYVDATGHSYENGVCTFCGQTESQQLVDGFEMVASIQGGDSRLVDAHNTVSPLILQDLTLFENCSISAVNLFVTGTVVDNDGTNANDPEIDDNTVYTFDLVVLDASSVKAGQHYTVKRTYTLSVPGSDIRKNAWNTFDVSHLGITVKAGETLGFGSSTSTLEIFYLSKSITTKLCYYGHNTTTGDTTLRLRTTTNLPVGVEGYKIKCDHEYAPTITAPTCTKLGYTTHNCVHCGDSYKNAFTDAVGHSWDDGVCTVCGAEKKPYQRLTYFTVDVVGENGKLYTDNAVLYLPANYTPDGEPVKLVIYCKQGASQITASSNPIEDVGFYNFLISLGYAVLGVDGVPDAWRDELGLGERAVGNPMAVQGTQRAYDYVVDNYNIASDGCFISGYSQGGHYAQNVIDLTDIPILAAAEQSPVCSMRYHQWDLNANQTVGGVKFTKAARLNVARIYGFPEFSTNSELLNLTYDASLVAEYDPWVRNAGNVYTGFVQKSNLWYLPAGSSLEDITMTKTVKCPIKIWCAEDDTAISADVMKVFVKAIQNAGGVAEISVASSGGHGFFQNQTAVGTFTENGKTYKTLPIAVEIAQWFEQYGGYECKHNYSGTICTVCGEEVKNYSGKVISILGGSTCTFDGYIPVADGFNLTHRPRYPQDNLLTDVNETWWMQVIAELDAKLGINDSWAGSTVSNFQDTNSGDLGPDAAMASLTRIQNLGANGTPDVILFYGAMNDIGKAVTLGSFDPAAAPTEADLTATKWDSFADAYAAAIMRMQYFYPDAKIVSMLPGPTASYYTEAERKEYCEVIQAICDHYGVVCVDLSTCGISVSDLPDGTHPDARGMDCITDAVLETLLCECEMEAGENVVYSVTHSLKNAKASLSYYKGISNGKSFAEVLTGENLTVTVTMGGEDITSAVYADGTISIPAVTGDLVINVRGIFDADGRLQQLPEKICSGTNLWTALEPENIYYIATGWGNNANSVYSVTFPVIPGERIWATSFGTKEVNQLSGNGTRITWFNEDGVLESLPREEIYAEFAANGYITVPEGALAVNIPMATNAANWEIYLLDRVHTYGNWYETKVPTCEEEGKESRLCDLCGYREDRIIASSHDLVQYEGKMPDCTQIGWMPYESCSRCAYTTYMEIPATGHSFERTIRSIAHRGYSWTAPENTVHSFKRAYEKGFTYVECDVTFTKDDVAVLLHDATIDRTSNGTGHISERTYSELLELDFGSWKNSSFSGTRILTFEELIALCSELHLHPYIELKTTGRFTREKVNQLVQTVSKYGLLDQVTWIGYDSDRWLLNYVIQAYPGARIGVLISSDVTQSVIDTANRLRTGDNEVFINAYSKTVTDIGLMRAAANGYLVEFYTLNSESVIKALPSLVSGVTSDWLNANEIITEANMYRVAPDCAEEGYTVFTCHYCGTTHFDEYKQPLGHSPGQPVMENETSRGYDKVVYCETCGCELSREAVVSHVPGDITGDGEVNNKDLTRLFKYLTGYDVQVNEAALDVNGDGSVNNKDQTRLFRYLSGWDVEIC